jgi:hypothetical protein
MGPYCQFCDTRCFVPLTNETPAFVLILYGNYGLMATCQAGKAFERQKLGVCYDDAMPKEEPHADR